MQKTRRRQAMRPVCKKKAQGKSVKSNAHEIESKVAAPIAAQAIAPLMPMR